MNIALIIAAGHGSRMGETVPKQFLSVLDKPVIIYTLEKFQAHPLIDAIEVVCLDGWQTFLRIYCQKYGISKLKWVVIGGKTGQESIKNGVDNLIKHCYTDDLVIIHDGVRPMVDSEIISDVIKVAREKGNGVSSTPFNEQMFLSDDEFSALGYIPRQLLRKMSTPQAYYLGKLSERYTQAFNLKIGISENSYTNTMMSDLGERLYYSLGNDRNIKLTTQADLEFFKKHLSE